MSNIFSWHIPDLSAEELTRPGLGGSARGKTTPRGTVELGELHRSHMPADGGDQLSPRRREELEEALEVAEMERILSRVSSMRLLTPIELSVLARSLERVVLDNGEYVYRQVGSHWPFPMPPHHISHSPNPKPYTPNPKPYTLNTKPWVNG